MKWLQDNLQIIVLVAWVLVIWIKKAIDQLAAQRRAQEARTKPDELPDGFEMEGQEEDEISMDDWEEKPVPPPPPSLPPPPLPPASPLEARPGEAKRDPLTEPAKAFVRHRSAALKRQLARRAETRRAIILKEILSRPVSLRSPGPP